MCLIDQYSFFNIIRKNSLCCVYKFPIDFASDHSTKYLEVCHNKKITWLTYVGLVVFFYREGNDCTLYALLLIYTGVRV